MWKRLTERWDDILILAAVAFVFCMVRTVASPASRSVGQFAAVFCVSIPVGTLAGLVVLDLGYSDAVCCFASAVGSYMAQNIATALAQSDGQVKKAIDNLIEKYTK